MKLTSDHQMLRLSKCSFTFIPSFMFTAWCLSTRTMLYFYVLLFVLIFHVFRVYLFISAVTSSDYIGSNCEMINELYLEKCWRRQSWHSQKYCPAEFWTRHFLNTSGKHYWVSVLSDIPRNILFKLNGYRHWTSWNIKEQVNMILLCVWL